VAQAITPLDRSGKKRKEKGKKGRDEWICFFFIFGQERVARAKGLSGQSQPSIMFYFPFSRPHYTLKPCIKGEKRKGKKGVHQD